MSGGHPELIKIAHLASDIVGREVIRISHVISKDRLNGVLSGRAWSEDEPM